jgi:uncharacterized delta-60 repeat protein
MFVRTSCWLAAASVGLLMFTACGGTGSASVPGSGDLDRSFGGDGTVFTAFASGLVAMPSGIAVQPDGRVVVAGHEQTPLADSSRIVLARYEADGALDAGFGAGGKVTTSFGTYDEARAVALQPDGKIAVAGLTQVPAGFAFEVVRYGRDGVLDAAFGIGGRVTTTFPAPWSSALAMGIAIQPDGKIVTAGAVGTDPLLTQSASIALARYDVGGVLDPTFGEGGIVVTSLPGASCVATGLIVQSGGKIVISGFTTLEDGTEESLLARYGSDGTLDAGFGTGGVVRTSISDFSRAAAIAIRPDGKIVAVGSSEERALGGGRTPSAVALARYDANGALDATFGAAGIVTTRFTGSAGAYAVALQGDGRIVAAGFFWATGAMRVVLAVVRYETDGRVDASFANAGMATTSAAYWATDVAIQPDGRIVVIGDGDRSPTDFTSGFAVARYVP